MTLHPLFASVMDSFSHYPATKEVRYRGYTIRFDPPPIPIRTMDWQFAHDDYDGATDSNDHRAGSAASINECKAEIDEIELELAQ